MSCKSALYAANVNDQTVAVGGVVNFGSVVRKYGSNCNLSGGNATVTGSGYYDVDTNFTFTAEDAGTVVIQLYKDGTTIVGAEVSKTVAAGSVYSLSIPAIIREVCCCESVITAVVTGVASTINNASIAVEKI